MCVETNLYRNLCVLEIVCVIHLLPLLAGFEAHILLFFFLAEKKKEDTDRACSRSDVVSSLYFTKVPIKEHLDK